MGVKAMRHFAQIALWTKEGEFPKYNYGPEENKKIYGQEKPPLYDLSMIRNKVIILYTDQDKYINQEAIAQL